MKTKRRIKDKNGKIMLVPFEEVANKLLKDEEVFKAYIDTLIELGIQPPLKK